MSVSRPSLITGAALIGVAVVAVASLIAAAPAGKAAAPGASKPPAAAPDADRASDRASATVAATAPAGPQTHTAQKGTLALVIEATGTFQPAEPFEVRLRPKQYKGDLTIVSAAANAAAVKKGDVILELDPADLKRELAAAENDLNTAQANHKKAVADAKLGTEADALALKMAQEAVSNAESELKWWDDVIGPQMLQQADLSVKQAEYGIGDQEDELEQLRKMYKEEELTSATADIVIKRALRQYDLSKVYLKMTKESVAKVKANDHPAARQKVAHAVDQARQGLEQILVVQEHGRVVRKAAVNTAKFALEAAEKRATELRADLDGLAVAAPADGVAVYGQLADAGWQAVDPKTMRAGEKLTAGGTVMTLFAPGKMKLAIDVPESKVSWVKKGMEAKVKPVAWPDMTLVGRCGMPTPVGKAGAAEQTFTVTIDFVRQDAESHKVGGLPAELDARILPGMKANVTVEAGRAEDVVLVPAAAVVDGKVRVRTKDGKEQERPVTTGKTDGQQVEVRKGLSAGEEVLLGSGR